MNSVADFLKRSAERNGFTRDRFEERKIPTDFSNVVILPFFGDLRSLCILSSLILNRYRSEVKSSKYFILASWPGFQSLFPYVDEYWSVNDFSHIKKFYEESDGFLNKSDLNTIYIRNFNEFFRDLVEIKNISQYYQNGFSNSFFEKFKNVELFLPFVSSSAILGKEFNRDLATYPGYKIFIHPSMFSKQWRQGKSHNSLIKPEFWTQLVNKLLEIKYTPVIWQNYLSYDLSQEFTNQCIFIKDNDVSKALTAMRATGFALSIFNSLSNLALLARCPYLSIDERSRYFSQKEYEIEDIFPDLQKDHIFTFSTILTSGNSFNWNQDILKIISSKLEKFFSEIDRDFLPSTGESFDFVSYNERVRKIKSKKFGTRLLHITKD